MEHFSESIVVNKYNRMPSQSLEESCKKIMTKNVGYEMAMVKSLSMMLWEKNGDFFFFFCGNPLKTF